MWGESIPTPEEEDEGKRKHSWVFTGLTNPRVLGTQWAEMEENTAVCSQTPPCWVVAGHPSSGFGYGMSQEVCSVWKHAGAAGCLPLAVSQLPSLSTAVTQRRCCVSSPEWWEN